MIPFKTYLENKLTPKSDYEICEAYNSETSYELHVLNKSEIQIKPFRLFTEIEKEILTSKITGSRIDCGIICLPIESYEELLEALKERSKFVLNEFKCTTFKIRRKK